MSIVSAFRFVMRLLLNVMLLNSSTAKKSADRRCLSRSASLVSMLAAWIVTSIVDVLGIRLIELNRAVEIGEASPHFREQISNLECRLGVGFVDLVGACRSRRCHCVVSRGNSRTDEETNLA